MFKNIKKSLIIGIFLFTLFFSYSAQAEEIKDYFYESVNTTIQINKDSTFDVEEQLKFNFQGTFNKGWRQISINKFDALTDISVIDVETGQQLEISSQPLDKLNSNNWGKYYWNREAGNYNIEWYYNFTNTSHEWIIKYKVHGGIGFYKNHDEIYWNLFSGFDKPIQEVQATVYLPAEVKDISLLQINFYKPENQAGYFNNFKYLILDKKTFKYIASDIPALQPLTIYAEWPKDIVNQSAYWLDFIKTYWGIAAIIPIVLIAIALSVIHCRKFERRGRKVIIPEYEPPQNIPPAMAELIIKEMGTSRSLPATIIDLAVRGYVKIEEESNNRKIKFFKSSIEYRVIKNKDFLNDVNLHDYEKEFLSAIFSEKDYFSTKEMKAPKNFSETFKYQDMVSAIQKLSYKVSAEVDKDTKLYERPLSMKKWQILSLVGIVIPLILFGFAGSIFSQILIVLAGLIVGTLIWLGFVKFNPYLSKEGAIIREKWLGFKLYLETAEKYRLQNLKPEYFEKYLPYAMIFGVEKKWAKSFENINLKQPSWYSGNAYMMSGGNNVGGFSASNFSASLSSSFASAFSTASGSSGSGGGGSAGGGGGGGGGGAS